MLTYTVRHYSRDGLAAQVDGLTEARRRATGGKAATAINKKFGFVGSVRALEVTYNTANGWHSHIHEIVFLDIAEDADLTEFEAVRRRLWSNAVKKAGLRSVNSHGFDLRDASGEIAQYLAKFGREKRWNISHELAKSHVKTGRESSKTAFQLLADFADTGDTAAGELFREFAACFKGRSLLHWSKGLRALLLPSQSEEKTDEQLAEEKTADGVLFKELTLDEWRLVCRESHHAAVLNLAAVGDMNGLKSLLLSLRHSPAGKATAIRVKREPPDASARAEAADMGLTLREFKIWKYGGSASLMKICRPVLR
jgi:hypothetical protein